MQRYKTERVCMRRDSSLAWQVVFSVMQIVSADYMPSAKLECYQASYCRWPIGTGQMRCRFDSYTFVSISNRKIEIYFLCRQQTSWPISLKLSAGCLRLRSIPYLVEVVSPAGSGEVPHLRYCCHDEYLQICRIFLIEGIITVLFGVCVWFFLPDCKSWFFRIAQHWRTNQFPLKKNGSRKVKRHFCKHACLEMHP